MHRLHFFPRLASSCALLRLAQEMEASLVIPCCQAATWFRYAIGVSHDIPITVVSRSTRSTKPLSRPVELISDSWSVLPGSRTWSIRLPQSTWSTQFRGKNEINFPERPFAQVRKVTRFLI